MTEQAKPTEFERAYGAGQSAEHHPVFSRFAPWKGRVAAGWDVNFLGVKTRTEFFSMFERLADYSTDRDLVTAPPYQNEDYFEWIDLLESVVAADARFRMIELGSGWGKWLTSGAVAARSLGIDYFVIGIEAEPTHFRWMQQHLRDNGVEDDHTQLIRAAVAAEDGSVWFHVGDAADWYGQRIEENAPAESRPAGWRRWLRRGGHEDGRHIEQVRAIGLRTLLADDEVVDLIDADIQGAEADVFEAAGERLTQIVRRVHVGTHSDENEERLRRLFTDLGWELLYDYPNGRTNTTPYGEMPFEDGVQAWLNPRLNGPRRFA